MLLFIGIIYLKIYSFTYCEIKMFMILLQLIILLIYAKNFLNSN